MRTPCLLVLLLSTALAQDPPRTPKEKQALSSAADELSKLAKLCVSNQAYSEAREELQRGLALSDSPKLLAEIQKIAAKPDAPKPGFAEKLEEERGKAHRKCADLLVNAAVAAKKGGKADAFERLIWLAAQHVPCEESFQKAGLVYFEPYLTWVTEDDAKRLEAGDERVDGKWVAAAEVQELDRKHANWTTPWILSDEVHEIHTTLPLRSARHLLAYVGAVRSFVLRQFAGLCDVRPPSGKLPVFVTENQGDMKACAEKEMARRNPSGPNRPVPSQSAAYYMYMTPALNPCFATLEPADSTGKTIKISLQEVLLPLTHELTHQILFEYCKYGADKSRDPDNHWWVVEGIANFVMSHALEKGRWRLTFVDFWNFGTGKVEGSFAWCVKNRASLPPLEEFFAVTRAGFKPNDYHIAATAVYFFCTAGNGKYRSRFAKLIEKVHLVADRKESFRDCFPGVDMKALQQEWLAFVEQIQIENP